LSRRSSRKHKHHASGDKRIIMPPDDIIGSDNFEDQSPNLTLIGLSPHTGPGLNIDGTVAPKIGENENEKEVKYAQNAAELVDKHFLSGKGISCALFIVILAIMGYIFIQDNQANKLTDWKSIWWSIQKCSFFLLLYMVFLLYQAISGHWKKGKL
jgi:hypothetical protein